MSRVDINRSGEMEVFARVVELGGFSAAARALRMTPSAVSKLIGRLEARLGARLLNRSTRALMLTAEGEAFHGRAIAILAEMEEAERAVAAGAAPRGRLRINSNVGFARQYLLPLIPGFTARYPDIRPDITVTDQVVDLLHERADVAIRVGPMAPSQLVARKLGESGMAIVASPDYLARHGAPRIPADLARHRVISFNFARLRHDWPFRIDGQDQTLSLRGAVYVGDGETCRRMALAGQGLGRMGRFHTARDIAAGRLVPVLEDFNPGDRETISAVYVGQGGPLPPRVRAFIDYLAETVDIDRPPPPID